MSQKGSGDITGGSSSTSTYSAGTAKPSSSSTATSSGSGKIFENAQSDNGSIKIEEVSAFAAQVAAARAEQIINERLSAATQAQALTSKMLDETTRMLEESTKLMAGITAGLNSSAKMQAQLETDVANIKGNAVAALSIFVSFFAFITVSINVFSKAGSVVSASALVLVFWCLLVGFNVVIGWQFNTLKNTGVAWFLLMLVSCLSVFAVVGMYYFSPELLSSAKPVMASG
ncbi:hypothetical protein [Pseudomonas juntendi]|uniref:hypothetical protein n=1 Tax=Pseudomonas juntendi TaxID=2666183 RepID=UPI0021B3ECC7|nr:hypothetical protein [Pseudomonas juntendi]UXA36793.1 hypothetical protein KZA81_14825 [Pseudomonas juntendi]